MKPDHLSRSSQQQRILLKLREMILNGELAPGARVAEIPGAGRLGVSRTPVRYALGVLAGEGLIVA
ncbi:GntR family transcriptional regulator, partial [Acinetobacter baumannii]